MCFVGLGRDAFIFRRKKSINDNLLIITVDGLILLECQRNVVYLSDRNNLRLTPTPQQQHQHHVCGHVRCARVILLQWKWEKVVPTLGVPFWASANGIPVNANGNCNE
jgi:hypothetical protein